MAGCHFRSGGGSKGADRKSAIGDQVLVTRKVFKDSTVTLHGTLYEVPSVLIGKRITLREDAMLAPLLRWERLRRSETGRRICKYESLSQ
jgi:hypothetical protein